MNTVLDSINGIAAADAAVATAESNLTAANAAVAAAGAALTDARAADVAADQQLSADLHASGPVFVSQQDGTVVGFVYDASNPAGFDSVTYKPAGSVASAAPTPSTPPASS